MHADDVLGLVFGALGVLGALLLTVVVFVGAAMLDAWECHAKWDAIGRPVRFGVLAGCQVQRKDGTWLPAGALRDLSL